MKNDFNLNTLLQHVSEGKMPLNKAKNMIEKHYISKETVLHTPQSAQKKSKNIDSHDSEEVNLHKSMDSKNKAHFKLTFDKFKKSVGLQDLIKKSTKFVHQISENVPQKIQENLSPIGFSAKLSGIDSKMSVFRSIQVSPDNELDDNSIVGCQWFGIEFSEQCKIKANKFMAMQLTEFSLLRSDLCDSLINLSRMSHVTFQESCFIKNKLTLSTWSDVSVTESDFTENTLGRTEFSGTVLNASRLSKLNFMSVHVIDCEFDSCDIQGIEFENCEFKDCSFSHIQATTLENVKISGRKFIGKQFLNCKTTEEFIQQLTKSGV